MTPTDPADLIETVLKFDDPVAAVDAYRSIRAQGPLSFNYSATGTLFKITGRGPTRLSGGRGRPDAVIIRGELPHR